MKNWHVGHIAIMLSFMFHLNMGLNSFTKAQKSSLDWWCHLHIGRYYWTRSTMLSYLLILVIKKDACFVVCLCLVAPNERILLKGLQIVLGLLIYKGQHIGTPGLLEALPIADRWFGSWLMDFITGLPICANVCHAIFTYVDRLSKYTVLTAYILGACGVECQTSSTKCYFLQCCQAVWLD